MTETNYTDRFKDAPWASKVMGMNVISVGNGGIGSWLTLFLSRMGCKIHLFDQDEIDRTNLGGQHYSVHDIGKIKSEVGAQQAREFSGNYTVYSYKEFTKDSPVADYMFSTVDNMETRKLIFNKWKAQDNLQLFLDGRMSMEDFQIFAVTQDTIEQYETTLFNDSEVENAACTMKATSHCGAMIASIMTSIFTNYIFNMVSGDTIREVPFSYSFNIDMLNQQLNLDIWQYSSMEEKFKTVKS